MSRPWSRYGVRAVAVALLLAGATGGYYLGEDRETQQQSFDAQLAADAEQIEVELLRERHAAHQRATAAKRAAEQEAARKAAEAAKAAAERAKKAEREASRKKAREAAAKKAREAAANAAANQEAPAFAGPIPASCNEFSGNRKIGCALLLDAGFGLDQMACLNKLWTKESGWNHKARNPSSGAYGIPQSYPGNKMASVAADWETNPATQIKWGLGYIKGRYSNPCGAWAKSQAEGFY